MGTYSDFWVVIGTGGPVLVLANFVVAGTVIAKIGPRQGPWVRGGYLLAYMAVALSVVIAVSITVDALNALRDAGEQSAAGAQNSLIAAVVCLGVATLIAALTDGLADDDEPSKRG